MKKIILLTLPVMLLAAGCSNETPASSAAAASSSEAVSSIGAVSSIASSFLIPSSEALPSSVSSSSEAPLPSSSVDSRPTETITINFNSDAASTCGVYNENGNKRRIFQNFLDAKTGDIIIGYESNPVKQIVAIGRVSAEQDGENTGAND